MNYQSEVKRYVVEDRFTAIRLAIGSAVDKVSLHPHSASLPPLASSRHLQSTCLEQFTLLPRALRQGAMNLGKLVACGVHPLCLGYRRMAPWPHRTVFFSLCDGGLCWRPFRAAQDVVVIAGKGHEDYMEYSDGQGGLVRGWFDDRVEARNALSKLEFLDNLTKLGVIVRSAGPPWRDRYGD